MKNFELIQKVVKLVTEERRIGVEILELLQEIERRKAYSELGYDGLFSFCVKELKYTEAQAVRRIQAMRAMSDLPELKAKMESGLLTVSTVSQVHTHLRRQKQKGVDTTKTQRLDLFESIQGDSSKQVEGKLRVLAGTDFEVKLSLSLDTEMSDAWEQIKNLSAHSTRGQSEAILKMLMKEWLKRNHPGRGATTVMKEVAQQKRDPVHVLGVEMHQRRGATHRYIPITTKRQVWARDQGKCTKCSSRFALQIDHQRPLAKSGTNYVDNLRLLCRSCNLHEGIKEFGLEKMRRTG